MADFVSSPNRHPLRPPSSDYLAHTPIPVMAPRPSQRFVGCDVCLQRRPCTSWGSSFSSDSASVTAPSSPSCHFPASNQAILYASGHERLLLFSFGDLQ